MLFWPNFILQLGRWSVQEYNQRWFDKRKQVLSEHQQAH